MKEIIEGRGRQILIGPGEIYATREDLTIITSLGSCVAVCLYDPFNHVAGMNHIVASGYENDNGSICSIKGGHVGFCAMDLLIRELLGLGACRQNFKAKVFGGASIFIPFDQCTGKGCIGKENIVFVEKYLRQNAIPIKARDLGSEKARKIFFDTADFSVTVRKIGKTDLSDFITSTEI